MKRVPASLKSGLMVFFYGEGILMGKVPGKMESFMSPWEDWEEETPLGTIRSILPVFVK